MVAEVLATAAGCGLNAALTNVYHWFFKFLKFKSPGIPSPLQPQPPPLLGTAHLRESENTHAHALGKHKGVGRGGAGQEGYFFFRLGGEVQGNIKGRGSGGARERGKEREARTTLPDR